MNSSLDFAVVAHGAILQLKATKRVKRLEECFHDVLPVLENGDAQGGSFHGGQKILSRLSPNHVMTLHVFLVMVIAGIIVFEGVRHG